jgi:hypothetical protein
LATRKDNDELDRLIASKAAPSALIPPTIMSWSNGPPPTQWRLPVDDELMLLARRRRSPCIRSDSTILAEFPTLDWDGPYRATRYFFYHFYAFTFINLLPLRRKLVEESEANVQLLRNIQESIRVYVKKMEQPPRQAHSLLLYALWQHADWLKNLQVLRMTIGNADSLEQIVQEIIKENKKNGRPPKYWKSSFVSGLAKLWRIMTGDNASKDLASPFASFVAAAWVSLGDNLPEISWASQICRRQDISPAAELVRWANTIRRLPAKHHALIVEEPDKS